MASEEPERSAPQAGRRPRRWLAGIHKVQALLDRASDAGIARMTVTSGGAPACRPGCDQCCRESYIPVNAPEIGAALLHLLERTPGPGRGRVLERLRERPGGQCPFLIDSGCSIYTDRFLACRQFHVFGEPCRDGGNIWELRPQDIPRPDPKKRLEGLRALAALSVEPPANMTALWLEAFLQRVSPPLHCWDLRSPQRLLALLDNAETTGNTLFFGPQG